MAQLGKWALLPHTHTHTHIEFGLMSRRIGSRQPKSKLHYQSSLNAGQLKYAYGLHSRTKQLSPGGLLR